MKTTKEKIQFLETSIAVSKDQAKEELKAGNTMGVVHNEYILEYYTEILKDYKNKKESNV